VLLINSCSEPAKYLPVDTVIGRGQLANAAKDNGANRESFILVNLQNQKQ